MLISIYIYKYICMHILKLPNNEYMYAAPCLDDKLVINNLEYPVIR